VEKSNILNIRLLNYFFFEAEIMVAEAYFNILTYILLALMFVAFSLAFIYLVYCEGGSAKTQKKTEKSKK